MGARINMENQIDALEGRLKLAEGALEEIIKKVDELIKNNTRVHHVDLHEDVKEIHEEKTEETVKAPTAKKKKVKEEKKEETVKAPTAKKKKVEEEKVSA